jgi:hypothetical protein
VSPHLALLTTTLLHAQVAESNRHPVTFISPHHSAPPHHFPSLVKKAALKIHCLRLPFAYTGPPPLSRLWPYIRGTKTLPQLTHTLVSLLLARSTSSMSSKRRRLCSSSLGHLIHPTAVCCCRWGLAGSPLPFVVATVSPRGRSHPEASAPTSPRSCATARPPWTGSTPSPRVYRLGPPDLSFENNYLFYLNLTILHRSPQFLVILQSSPRFWFIFNI